MQVTNIHNAKSNLSKLVELAFDGEEIVICKAGKPMARLIKYQQNTQPRIPGMWQGKVKINEDFDEFPHNIQALFLGDEA